jgi:hypothetical protein
MRKILLAVVMALVLAVPVVAGDAIEVLIDDYDKITKATGLLINDTTYVPIRAVSDGLGANVSWTGSQVIVTGIKEPEITGGSDSAHKVRQALNLLKTKTPVDYEIVCRYADKIVVSDTQIESENRKAYALAAINKKTIELSPSLFRDKDIVGIASTLVHEAVHIGDSKCNSFFAAADFSTENNAFLHQIAVLRILGASQKEIDKIEATRKIVINR